MLLVPWCHLGMGDRLVGSIRSQHDVWIVGVWGVGLRASVADQDDGLDLRDERDRCLVSVPAVSIDDGRYAAKRCWSRNVMSKKR
mmetsp:Transcript_5453/g.15420  ORF Transcript_5453/g.15420 Transcript_5453/m.15420 type:complete len:85 (-) Transcript_5453:779-1033(-)